MVNKLHTYIHSYKIHKLFTILAVLSLFTVSGCTVLLSPLMYKEGTLYQEGKYDELKQYIVENNGRLTQHEKRRIIAENINKIKTNQMTSFEFLFYQLDREFLAKAYIELGEFENAIKVCDEGIAESELLSNLFKRHEYRYESTIELNKQVHLALTRTKGFSIWFMQGDKATALKYINMSMVSDPSASSYITFTDTLSKQKMDYLLENGYFYDKIRGDHQKAKEYFQQVLELSEKLTLLDIDLKYAYKMQSYLKLMNIDVKLGKLEEAQATLHRWSEMTDDVIFRAGKVVTSASPTFRGYLSQMDSYTGALYALERDTERSKQYFDKSLKIIKTIPPDSQEMPDLKAIGTYYVLYGAYYFGLQPDKIKEAIDNTDKGLSYLRPYYLTAMMDNLDIEDAYLYSGELHFRNRDYETATERANKALEHSERMRNSVTAAAALTLLGQINYENGRYREAKQSYEKARKLVEHVESTENWKLYYGLGQVYEDTGDKTSALKYYGKAVDEVEKLWNGRFKDTVKQVSFIDDRLIVFEAMIRILHAQGKDKEAIRYMEMSKARTLYEASPFYPTDAGRNIKAWTPDKPMSISDLRASVSDKTAILEYYVGARSVLVAVITKNEVHIEELHVKDLQEDVISFNLAMGNPTYYPKENANRLYTALLLPLKKYLTGFETLCIIPHGVLHYLPFQALLADENNQTYLIDKYKIFYAPSLTILNSLHKLNSNKKTRLLAVANSQEIDIKDMNVGKDKLGSLTHVKEEVQEVGSLFNDQDKTVIVDDKATQSYVKDNAHGYDVVMFSTHGLLVRKEPLKSCIFLSRDSGNNGRLTVADIEGMELNASLVILSACETGLLANYKGNGGDDNPYNSAFSLGDDLAGLQRAFMRAGSASILSTLWSVNDAATKSFIVDFVRHYKSGNDKLSALQTAAIDIKSNPKWEHPYYWAPFILSGDWR